MSLAERRCELEALESAEAVVGGYRPESDSWRFAFDSPFWLAVAHAHSLGARGSGKAIAVIDTGCDPELPRLRQRVARHRSYVPTGKGGSSTHGTAVALLIAEVAPECSLHVYDVVRDDGVDPYALRAAIGDAAVSDAAIINLSVGSPRPLDVGASALRVMQAFLRGEDVGETFRAEIAETPVCELCRAAQSAAGNKMVLAAVGNTLDEIYCPSCAEGVFAVGFQGVRRERVALPGGGWTEKAFGTGPGAAQAVAFDLAIGEIDGVLGSSFACPLHAGAAALGLTSAELKAYVRSIKHGALAQMLHGTLGTGEASAEAVRRTRESYEAAVRALPHVHDEVQASLRDGGAPADPAKCAACGIYAHSTIANYGLFLGECKRPDLGRVVLETASVLAPWDPHAAANLGATYRELGRRTEAVEQYRRALRLRPGFEVYQEALDALLAARPR